MPPSRHDPSIGTAFWIGFMVMAFIVWCLVLKSCR